MPAALYLILWAASVAALLIAYRAAPLGIFSLSSLCAGV